MTPEERAAIEKAIADLTAQMKALDHLNKPENLTEWGALYEARELLDKLLTDEPLPGSQN